MWLTDYLQKRWGLLALVAGLTLIGLWLLGGGKSAQQQQTAKPGSAKPGSAKAALKAGSANPAGVSTPKKLTVASVTGYCTQRGVAAARPAQSRHQTVRHPGFPAPRTSPPTMGAKARGLFPMRRRFRLLGARQPAHARLIHRLAQGFAERYRYFEYLSENRRAASRYYRRQAERRRKKGLPATPGSVAPTGKTKPPPSSVIALKARGYRKNSLGYYRELATSRTLARYKSRPRALLEYASLTMAPLPRLSQRRTSVRKKRTAKTAGPTRRSTAGLRILHQLLEDHPLASEAIEAMALLAHQSAARGQCPKIVFLLKKLSTATLPPKTSARTALLRGLAHYHAGRCLLKQGSHAAAAKRLWRAATDGHQAQKAGAKLGGTLAREAAIAWATAYGAVGDTSGARAQLGRLGPKLANVATGVLVAQLLKEGQLRTCMRLCAPPKSAPKGAK